MEDTNIVTLIGRLTKDPVFKVLESGTNVGGFTLAVNGRGDKCSYINVKTFGKLAEIICTYATKGKQIAITGRIETSSWEKDGVRHYATDVIANSAQLLGKKDDTTQEHESHDDVPF